MKHAQLAYETYCTHNQGRSPMNGAFLPEWRRLPVHIKKAWQAVADALTGAKS